MKKLAILVLFFLASCQAVSKPLDAFEVSERCPNVCWLGINPGLTTTEQARSMLRASDQIDQNTFHVRDAYIETNWFFQKTNNWHSHVFVYLENNHVKSIEINQMEASTLSDFISILGEPNEIRVGLFESQHCEEPSIHYSLYYSSRKTILGVSYGDWRGPSPDDVIGIIKLNGDFDNEYNQPLERQPWLGYRNLSEYLSGEKLPTGPCQP